MGRVSTVNNCGLWNTGYWFSNLHHFSYWENIWNKKSIFWQSWKGEKMAKNKNNYPRRQQSWPSQSPAVPRPNNCHLWHWGDEGEGTLHTTPINEKEQQQSKELWLAQVLINVLLHKLRTGVKNFLSKDFHFDLLHFLIQPSFLFSDRIFFIWISHFQAEPSSSPAEPLVAGYFRALNISARISCRPQGYNRNTEFIFSTLAPYKMGKIEWMSGTL